LQKNCSAMASSSSIQRFVRVGVGCLIESVDYPGFCILGRRLGSHGAGQFALPGGHLEVRDVAANCLISCGNFLYVSFE
jgi:8-oxo-dGTP diphosphatase